MIGATAIIRSRFLQRRQFSNLFLKLFRFVRAGLVRSYAILDPDVYSNHGLCLEFFDYRYIIA